MRRVASALVIWVSACSSELPEPKTGSQPVEAAVAEVVEYPPPPAQPEIIPPDPQKPGCVWLDGHWDWVGSQWTWVAGEWIVPPSGCYLAPAVLRWPKPGQLLFLKPHWFPHESEALPTEAARKACPAPAKCGGAGEPYRPNPSAPAT